VIKIANRFALVVATACICSSLAGCFYSHKEVQDVPVAQIPAASSSSTTTTTTRSDDGAVERHSTTTYTAPIN
jgi:hypothetical protein